MRILIANDGSKFSEAAIRKACELAPTPKDICFRVITVYEPQIPLGVEPHALSAENFTQLDEVARENAERVSKEGVELIKARFPNQPVCVTGLVELGQPAQTIIEAAESWDADLIVVGSHGHGFWGRIALGSVSDAVVHNANCSVVVVKPKSDEP